MFGACFCFLCVCCVRKCRCCLLFACVALCFCCVNLLCYVVDVVFFCLGAFVSLILFDVFCLCALFRVI